MSKVLCPNAGAINWNKIFDGPIVPRIRYAPVYEVGTIKVEVPIQLKYLTLVMAWSVPIVLACQRYFLEASPKALKDIEDAVADRWEQEYFAESWLMDMIEQEAYDWYVGQEKSFDESWDAVLNKVTDFCKANGIPLNDPAVSRIMDYAFDELRSLQFRAWDWRDEVFGEVEDMLVNRLYERMSGVRHIDLKVVDDESKVHRSVKFYKNDLTGDMINSWFSMDPDIRQQWCDRAEFFRIWPQSFYCNFWSEYYFKYGSPPPPNTPPPHWFTGGLRYSKPDWLRET